MSSFSDVLGAGEHEAAARAAQGLVGGARDQIGVRDGTRVQPGSHQPGDVRHVHHQHGAHLARHRGEALEIDEAR